MIQRFCTHLQIIIISYALLDFVHDYKEFATKLVDCMQPQALLIVCEPYIKSELVDVLDELGMKCKKSVEAVAGKMTARIWKKPVPVRSTNEIDKITQDMSRMHV